MDIITAFIWLAVLGIFIVLVAYAASRAASYAHYMTRLQFFRSLMREGKPQEERKTEEDYG